MPLQRVRLACWPAAQQTGERLIVSALHSEGADADKYVELFKEGMATVALAAGARDVNSLQLSTDQAGTETLPLGAVFLMLVDGMCAEFETAEGGVPKVYYKAMPTQV